METKDKLARMDNMIDQFLDCLRHERNRSENTVESYSEALHAFEAYFKGLDAQLSWASVDADVIRDWMESLMEKGNVSSTVCARVSAVRSFFVLLSLVILLPAILPVWCCRLRNRMLFRSL